MSCDDEIANMLIDLAGGQRLPANINIEKDVIDESDEMSSMEVEVNKYIKEIDNFNKQLHDKVKKHEFFEGISQIIDKYSFEVKDDFKKLWEIYIFNGLPITGKSGDSIDEITKELINKIRKKVLNNSIRTSIDNEIRTPSKIKGLVKKVLNSDANLDFVGIFTIDVKSLTKVEQTKLSNMELNDSKHIEYLDSLIENLDYSIDDDKIVMSFYNHVRLITSNKVRNEYYNKILSQIIKDINVLVTRKSKIPKTIINILIQLYCYLIQHEKIKTVNTDIKKYFANSKMNWFSYQVKEMSTILYPHWNFNTKDFILDAWQKSCLENIDLKNNILLSAPTSSGKTLLSTYAINKYRKIWYIVPSEALAYQLTGIILASLMDKEKLVGSVKKNVRLEIDSLSYKRMIGRDDIVISTPKQMYNMISTNQVETEMDYIILDEFHNISFEEGEYYEYLLKYGGFNKIPVMCLSATLPNFDEVYEWLSTILWGTIYGVNEHKRFFNQKRMIVKDKKLVTINPLEHMTKEILKSDEFSNIGLYPKEIFNLYEKLTDVPRMDEKTPRFIKLDDLHKLENDIFKHLKGKTDEVLDDIISSREIDSDKLTVFELYTILKNCNSSVKPMLVFKMDSHKCLEIYDSLIELIKDYNKLVYDNFNEDQGIISSFFAKVEQMSAKLEVGKNEDVKDLEEKKHELREEIFNSETKPQLQIFYDKYVTLRCDEDGIPQNQPLIDMFNKKYGANLTKDMIIKLRKEHVDNEFARCNAFNIGLRDTFLVHPECCFSSFLISPENMRKIRNKINTELKRESAIYGEEDRVKGKPKMLDIYKMKHSNTITYDHPFMAGLELGILCYNELMNPALQRMCQQLINKYPFITFSDKSLAVGINYPIKTVMLLGGLKGEPTEDINNTLAHQAIGRAGRRGLDKEGVVIYSGVNITNILVQQYKSVKPNDKSVMEKLFLDDSDFKTFAFTGVRPIVVEKIKEEPESYKEIVKETKIDLTPKPTESWEEFLKKNENSSWEDWC